MNALTSTAIVARDKVATPGASIFVHNLSVTYANGFTAVRNA